MKHLVIHCDPYYPSVYVVEDGQHAMDIYYALTNGFEDWLGFRQPTDHAVDIHSVSDTNLTTVDWSSITSSKLAEDLGIQFL